MKKISMLLVVAMLMSLFAACSSNETTKEVPTRDLLDASMALFTEDDMDNPLIFYSDAEENSVESIDPGLMSFYFYGEYDMEMPALEVVEEFAMVIPSGLFAFEVNILKAKSAADVNTVKEMMESRLSIKREDRGEIENYDSSQLPAFDSAEIWVTGKYVILIASENNAAIKETVAGLLGSDSASTTDDSSADDAETITPVSDTEPTPDADTDVTDVPTDGDEVSADTSLETGESPASTGDDTIGDDTTGDDTTTVGVETDAATTDSETTETEPVREETTAVTTKPAETSGPSEPTTETQPVETEPVETKPVETKPVETKPVETKPVETKPVETKPVETKPVETQPVETQPVETKPVVTEPVKEETTAVTTQPAETTAPPAPTVDTDAPTVTTEAPAETTQPALEKSEKPNMTISLYSANTHYFMGGKCAVDAKIHVRGGVIDYTFGTDAGNWMCEVQIPTGVSTLYLTQEAPGKAESDPIILSVKSRSDVDFSYKLTCEVSVGDNAQGHFEGQKADYEGTNVLNFNQISGIKKRVKEKVDYLSDIDCELIYVIVPNPVRIYPETAPQDWTPSTKSNTRTAQFIDAVESVGATVIDLTDILTEHSNDEFKIFHKTDSHWTDYGAYWGHYALFDYISEKWPDATPLEIGEDVEFYTKEVNGGDMVTHLEITARSAIKENATFVRWLTDKTGNNPNIYVYGRNELTFDPINKTVTEKNTNKGDKDLPTAMIIRDSYSTNIYGYLNTCFSEVYWQKMWSYKFDQNYIKRTKPDYYIVLVTERNLDGVFG